MRSEISLLLFFCTISPVIFASISNINHKSVGDSKVLQVIVSNNQPVSAVLGGSLTLPCLVSLPEPVPSASTLGRHAPLTLPRIRWSWLSPGQDTEVLVALGHVVKVSELYKGRASLPNYISSPGDLTLQLDGLRHSDSGVYRCEVQQGLEDAHDLVTVKVKGVVFHYQHASGHYALSFWEAHKACDNAGAHMATPAQLWAAYHSGLEQCHSGWLSDQTVGFVVQHPSEGCSGDMGEDPGMRSYEKQHPEKLYDVYCFVEDIAGKILYDSAPQHLTLEEAKAYCGSREAELATLGQMYAAWHNGLHHCSPGWLADGSVRYPVVTPTEHCGGLKPGVRTIYRYHNQSGLPEPHSRHDVYCFQGQDPLLKDTLVDFNLGQQEKSGPGGPMATFPVFERPTDVTHLKEITEVVTPMELTQVDISFHDGSQNDSTSEFSSNNAQFKEVWSSVQNAWGPKHHQSIPETYLKPSDPTPASEKSFEGLKSLTESVVEFSDPTVSSRNPSVAIKHLLMNETNKSRELFSSPGASGGINGHYSPLPELNPEPSDPIPLAGNHQQYERSNAELDASIISQSFNEPSKHYQPMYETNLQSSGLSKSVYQTSQSPTDIKIVFEHSVDNSSYFNFTPTVQLESGTVTSPFSSSEEQDTVVPSASPASWYSFPLQESERQEEKISELNETSTSALPLGGDQDLHLGLSTLSSEWDVTTPYTPPKGAKESVPSSSLTGSAATWFDVKGQSVEQNASVLEEPKDSVTSGPPDTDLTLTLHDVQSTIIPEVFDPARQPTVMWPESTASREQVEQEVVGTSSPPSVGGSNGSTGVDSTWVPSGIVGTNSSTPVEDTEEASGQQWLEIPITSADLGGFSDSFSPMSSGAGSSEFSGGQEILPSGGFAVKLMTSPGPLTSPEPTSPFWAAEAEASGASYVHVQPDPLILTEQEHSGVDQVELEEFTETHEVTFPAVTHSDESTVSRDGILQRGEFEVSQSLQPSSEPGELLASAFSLEEPTEVIQDTTFTEPGETSQSSATLVPATGGLYEATLNSSMSHDEEEHNATAPTAVMETTLSPNGTQSPRWDVEPSPVISQEHHLELEYTTKHPDVTQGPVLDSSEDPKLQFTTPQYPTDTFTTSSSFETQKYLSALGHSAPPEEDYFQHLTSTAFTLPLVDANQAETKFAPTQPPLLSTLPIEKAEKDACFESPCLNGGTCIEEGDSTKCLCLPTYGGDFCHIDLEPCENGWEKFQGFCYKHFTNHQAWEVAEQQCRAHGGHLASVMSPEEQDFINTNYKEYQWTGLNDRTLEGHFHWSDGNPLLYENWYNGQPDSYFLSGEDCVVMVWHDGGLWSDVPCNYHLPYTCKKGPTSCGEPPNVSNARVSSKVLRHYEVGSMVRYYCTEGFWQRRNPVIKCLPSGQWEEPQVTCVPVFQGSVDDKQIAATFSQSEEAVLDDTAVEEVAPAFWNDKWNV